MILLIDSGNSCIKWAWATTDSFVIDGYCQSNTVSSLHEKWKNYDAPVRVIVSNVAGERVASEIRKAVSVLWQKDAEFVVSSQSCCGLTNSYHNPEQLGIDRWMAMVAACQMIDGPAIIVDCGTAVTIDLVDEDKLFVGGVILPGLSTAFQSLRTDTDAVEGLSSIKSNTSPVAQSTEDGVVAGVVLGLAGGIDRVIRDQSSLTDKTPVVFMTGGDARKIAPYLTMPVVMQPDLVLQGLRIVASQRP